MNGKSSNPPDLNSLLAQQCMTFSAIVKAMQGHLTADNVLPVLDKVWHWTKVTLGEAALGIPKEPTATNNTSNPITEKQQKRLFAITKKVGMSNDALKTFLKEHYGIESTKDIPWKQYEEICTAVETGAIPF